MEVAKKKTTSDLWTDETSVKSSAEKVPCPPWGLRKRVLLCHCCCSKTTMLAAPRQTPARSEASLRFHRQRAGRCAWRARRRETGGTHFPPSVGRPLCPLRAGTPARGLGSLLAPRVGRERPRGSATASASIAPASRWEACRRKRAPRRTAPRNVLLN